MPRLLCIYVLSLTILQLIKAERRILAGKKPSIDRRYVAYMIKATPSVLYDAWICGGAIVSPWYIVTSAACVEDVKHMYAIAGYKKYVPYDMLTSDACTAAKKKKIVYVCLPSEYDFDYPKVERWANIDIALVKVETAYDFNDASYQTHCSYIPNLIEINYDQNLQDPGTDAIVFGWGHTKKWRSIEDTKDYNQDDVLYGSVRLAPKEECKKYFDETKVKNIIDKYMICSLDEGKLKDDGDFIQDTPDPSSFKTACGPGTLRMGYECIPMIDYTRRNANMSYGLTRRKGICQNDHGGPIITWRGPREVLLGVASVFRVQGTTKECIPPFLYTSTHCNGAFLNCLISIHCHPPWQMPLDFWWRLNLYQYDVSMSTHNTSLLELTVGLRQFVNSEKPGDKRLLRSGLTDRCDELAKQGGFKIIRRSISWVGHPDGPAANEINAQLRRTKDENGTQLHLKMRPQIKFENIG